MTGQRLKCVRRISDKRAKGSSRNERAPAKGAPVVGARHEVELLREMLDETKADRDSWKSQAQKVTALIENQSAKKGFWARLTGG